jgi:hypothetical protein
MAESPLLAMPRPERRAPQPGRAPRETIRPAEPDRQAIRVGPKFDRLEHSLPDPQALAELRDDPTAIVPERALVFEVASDVADFYKAVRSVPGLEFLGEDEGEAAPDEDFYVSDKDGEPKPDKAVPRRFYFTIPDRAALEQLVSLWRRYQRGEELGYGRAAWKHVFGHLADIRPWGPQDRLTQDAVEDWEERLATHPDEPIRFEVEFWYRDDAAHRATAETGFREQVEGLNGRIIDRAVIDPIRYHASLLEVQPGVIREVLDHQDVGLATFNDVMVMRPQSLVSGPVEGELEEASPAAAEAVEGELGPPVAALLDGLPMAQHGKLSDRLVIDDPDDFEARYGAAGEQRHGTAMASLILHGDLNDPNPLPPLQRQLFSLQRIVERQGTDIQRI